MKANWGRVLVFGGVALCASILGCAANAAAGDDDLALEKSVAPLKGRKPELPVWPYPRNVKLDGGQCDLSGKPVYVPAKAGEKTVVIAEALAGRLAAYLKLGAGPVLKREGVPPGGLLALSVGMPPSAWSAAAKECVLDKAHPTIRSQGYLLKIAPQGAVLVSPSARGLSYGAITLMQLARCGAEGTSVPCVTILDWPEVEVRTAVAGCPTYPLEHRRQAGRLCWEGKINVIDWWNQGRSFPYETHPEGGGTHSSQAEWMKVVDEVRALGVEAIPCHDMGLHTHSGNLPHIFLGDNETYFWAMNDMIDEELEMFRPRYMDLNMAEEHHIRKTLFYPGRSFVQWRDATIAFMKHLRRKGVMGLLATESLFPQWAGGGSYPWTFGKKFPDGYFEFTATFPNDVIFHPWFYWTKSTEDALQKSDLRRQAQTGLPLIALAMGVNVRHHVAAYRTLKNEFPNFLGVGGSVWGGDPFIRNTQTPRHPYYVDASIGQLWNLDTPERSEKFRWDEKPGISNWECLLDAEPPDSVDGALKRLSDSAWRTWLEAREQLVTAGLPEAPALLAAMSKAEGEQRDRIEGCLSRVARDARRGRKRGELEVSKVVLFLRDKSEAVRDMAAELAASGSEGGAAALRKSMRDATAGASCIRALGIVKDKSCAKELIEILGNNAMPARARSESARALGLLKAKEAEAVLREALRTGKEKEIRKESLWALALLGVKDADKEMSSLLESDDDDTRYRAAIALVILKSPETKKLAAWLSRDRHSLELAGWAMWKTWKKDEAKKALADAGNAQKDETSRNRLDQIGQIIAGTADKKVKY